MQLTWLGHSCVLLSGTKKVLIDPYIEGGSIARTKPDIVAVTHGHDDHMGETVALGKPTVAITEIAKYLMARGVPAEGMNIGGTLTVGGVSFTMTPAQHSSSIGEAGPGFSAGAPAGFVIRMDGVPVYHAGDTGLFSDMRLIGELYHPQVALLPIGGRYTMGPAEAMMAANFVGAKLVIPIHYNTWDKIRADAGAFKKALEQTTDIRVRILEPGGSVELPSIPSR
jgi:L-ascorbate metabolism protein UlaG (beta-lactamase superfamily)